jgi:hypothetical protein
MRPCDLYEPVMAPKKRASPVLNCDYCDERVKEKASHKCYQIEMKIRQKVTKEIKHEIKTETSRSVGFQNEPTSSTIPKPSIPLSSDED